MKREYRYPFREWLALEHRILGSWEGVFIRYREYGLRSRSYAYWLAHGGSAKRMERLLVRFGFCDLIEMPPEVLKWRLVNREVMK